MLLGDLIINHDNKRIPLSARQRENIEKKYPYYGAQGNIDYVADYLFEGKYLLIAEDGENLRSRKQPIATIVEGKFWVNNHAHIVTSNELSNLEFLCFWLNSNDISEYITGSAQPKLNQNNMNFAPTTAVTCGARAPAPAAPATACTTAPWASCICGASGICWISWTRNKRNRSKEGYLI